MRVKVMPVAVLVVALYLIAEIGRGFLAGERNVAANLLQKFHVPSLTSTK